MKVSDPINYIQGQANYLLKDSLEPHITEQVALRTFLCSTCLSNGKCTECGCKTPNMFYSPLKVDSKGRWGKFMDKAQWEALKNNYKDYAAFFDGLTKDQAITRGTNSDHPINGDDSPNT